MRQTFSRRVSKDHRLHATEDCRKRYTERQQQNGRRPGLLLHGGRQNKKFTGKYTERRRAENGQSTHHQSPADGGAQGD